MLPFWHLFLHEWYFWNFVWKWDMWGYHMATSPLSFVPSLTTYPHLIIKVLFIYFCFYSYPPSLICISASLFSSPISLSLFPCTISPLSHSPITSHSLPLPLLFSHSLLRKGCGVYRVQLVVTFFNDLKIFWWWHIGRSLAARSLDFLFYLSF